ncbi:MAG: hypothetical protein ACI915_000116 [Gammaproteobacteria bacterium]|jgi:hypothetical protein
MAEKIRSSDDRSLFLPGETSIGHHQIELACNACHTKSFTDKDGMQLACESCHLEQLKVAKDDHPKTKFTDPRNVERVALLDARYCVTCHVEHRLDITLGMGLTMPADYCVVCHQDIAKDRPSHSGMAFDTCASAGCHNFHDNRALYEDFLVRHLDEAELLAERHAPARPNLLEVAPQIGKYPTEQYPFKRLNSLDADAPLAKLDGRVVKQCLDSKHASGGVNCSACHQQGYEGAWNVKPEHDTCKTCHEPEVASFLHGKHGMRIDIDRLGKALSPMSPSLVNLPMKETATGLELGCSSCHNAHSYDIGAASTDGCLTCHGDKHSRAFKSSPHFVAQEQGVEESDWAGLSCASCHMPIVDKEYFWGEVTWTFANHNQSENLLPNEKMIRPVCANCHELQYSLDSLADRKLIERNFDGKPAASIRSKELARARLDLATAAREAAREAAQAQPIEEKPSQP